jgi:hypothetical protein
VVSLRPIYQPNREFFFLSLVWASDQVINCREVPLSDFGTTSEHRRGPRSLPPLWHTELIWSASWRTLSVRLNRSGCESDTLPQSSDEVKNACSYAFTNQLVFRTWWTEDGVMINDVSVGTFVSSLCKISLCIPFLRAGFSFPLWDSNHYR